MCGSEDARLSESQTQVVRAELVHLLESGAFRNSKRCREFLEYIVEHTINGPRGTLKERSIGVELFQLPQDFDTGQHTIVRVTANEVRCSEARPNEFHLYRVFNFGPEARLYMLQGSLSSSCHLDATEYRAFVQHSPT